jgi:hypothetical protein
MHAGRRPHGGRTMNLHDETARAAATVNTTATGTAAAAAAAARKLVMTALAVAALASLSACGGGTQAGSTPSMQGATALPARPEATARAAAAPQGSADGPGELGTETARYDPTLLFDWAEQRYPDWFPGPQADRASAPYVYRYYPGTGNHLGVAGDTVAVLGPISDGQLLPVGQLADWECEVLPNRCTTTPTLADRRAAAAAAATHADCQAAAPFHWSIGDAGGRLAEGQVGVNAPDADTLMPIASASKWLYGAYVAEVRHGELTAEDVGFLNFTSGYTEFGLCLQRQTVAECQAYQGGLIKNGGFDPAQIGRFDYSGGHMQKHAVLMGLGDDDNSTLAQHVGDALGLSIAYTQPQLAGGVTTSADMYGRFLRRVVAGRLKMAGLLGENAVCTNPETCPSAVYSPIAGTLSWHYAVGHWVEDDPAGGDGAYSSAGAFGFYPWIDHSRTWWGIVARHDTEGLTGDDPNQRPARDSVACGARIRAAWIGGSGV